MRRTLPSRLTPTAGRRRDDTGTAIVELTWLTILLLVPLVYLLLGVFELQRAAFAVDTAARAAGRAFVLAPDQGSAYRHAELAVDVALQDQGLDPARRGVQVSCAPDPARCLTPEADVTVVVQTQVRLPLLPDWFGDLEPTVRVVGEHRVPYGTFREAR